MTEAWMKRGLERQEFLEDLQRRIMNREEGDRISAVVVQISLSRALAVQLASYEGVVVRESLITPESYYVHDELIPAIAAFGRTPEEVQYLLAELFGWVCESIKAHFTRPLKTQEMMEPERVFDGHQTMDEVPITD